MNHPEAVRCPFAKELGVHPRVVDFIIDVVTWRKTQNAGLNGLAIPGWMADMLRHEMGQDIKAIDGVKLTVIPNTENPAISMGLLIESNGGKQ